MNNNLLEDSLLAVLLVQAAAVELSRTFDDSTNLRKRRNVVLRIVLLVVALRVEDIPHFKEL